MLSYILYERERERGGWGEQAGSNGERGGVEEVGVGWGWGGVKSRDGQ